LVWSSTNWLGAGPSAAAGSGVGVGKGETGLGTTAGELGSNAGVGKGETGLGAAADGVGSDADGGEAVAWLGTMAGEGGAGVAVPQPAITRLRARKRTILVHLQHASPDGREIADDLNNWHLTRI
jgi:hypothetical protein